MLDETIKVAYLMNNRNLYSTITEMIQKYTSPKEELIRIWFFFICVGPCIIVITEE